MKNKTGCTPHSKKFGRMLDKARRVPYNRCNGFDGKKYALPVGKENLRLV